MIVDELAGAAWSRVGLIGVEAATVGFIDAAAIAEAEAGRAVVEGPSGTELLIGEWHGVMASTGEDGALDVEVLYDLDGSARALRIEFVDDVATSDGEWSDWQELTISTGSVAACDPFCCANAAYRLVLGFPTGTHRVQRFVAARFGVLGIRLIAS